METDKEELAIEQAAEKNYEIFNKLLSEGENSILIRAFIDGAKSPEAKEYHTKGMYTEAQVNELIKSVNSELIKLANNIINPACDILPETYDKVS